MLYWKCKIFKQFYKKQAMVNFYISMQVRRTNLVLPL